MQNALQGVDFMQDDKIDSSVAAAWPPYHWLENPQIEPIVYEFWRAKYDADDLAIYARFLDMLRLSRGGLNGDEIGRELHVNNVRKYLAGKKKSFLSHLRAEHERLGRAEPAHKWLPLRLKPRGTPSDDWIQVPTTPLNFQGIRLVIEKFTPGAIEGRLREEFGFESQGVLHTERINLFGFFLGSVVGDASKRLKGSFRFPSRAISFVLSKNKPNSLRFGEFASLCANASLDLNMHRVSDLPVTDGRFGKTECYHWLSSSTPLISWIFNECLGLEDGETTTYDVLKMGWILDAPRDFRVHFLQGLSESDAWPSPGTDTVELVSSPNTDFIELMLEKLGCHARRNERPPVQVLSIPTREAISLPIFSNRVASNLYRDTKILAEAARYPERIRLPEEAIEAIRRLSKSSTTWSEVCMKLATETGYKVSSMTVKKYSETQLRNELTDS